MTKIKVALAIGVVCMLFSCKNQGKIESDNLRNVVIKYRGAEDIDKAGRAEDIKRTNCTTPDVCAAREKCFDAATGYVRAKSLTEEAKGRYAKLESGELKKDDPSVLALPKMIDDAEAALKASRSKMDTCDAMLDELSVAHR